MRAADLTTALILFGLAGIVLVDALRLGIGWSTDGPRSGFFPFWLAVVAMAACVAIAAQAARRRNRDAFVTREQARPVLKVIVPAAGLVIVMQVVGLYVASALYIGLYMRWIGRHAWWLVIVLGVAIPVVTFVIFERWFLVPMPKGPLEDWLGY
jgi:putative tricarboxylic transport membrane protein